MSSILHITNGDNLTSKLKELNLPGDIITWREMLCEGKTESNVGSESFWKTRFEFLNKYYKVSKSHFIEKTLKEYRALCNHKKENHIILWFQYDLFSQVNLLALVSWLKAHRKYAEISLICTGKENESGKLYGLNELSNDQLIKLFNHKIILSKDDIEYGDYVWQLYCSNNPIRLENLSDYNNYNFKHLENSIKAHLRRFPSIKNGLNEMETAILKLAMEKKSISKSEFVNVLLKNQGVLGFGDIQFSRALSRLKPLFSSFNPVGLTSTGRQILQGQTSYYSCIQQNDVYLGGALKYDFLFNSDTNRILKL